MAEETFIALDRVLHERGFESRSQAISEMIRSHSVQQLSQNGAEVMAGTLTLVYDESKNTLLRDLTRIFRKHIAEVISSQHVLLESDHAMEVILMQGPCERLHEFTNQLATCKGVKSAYLTLTPYLIPPLHAKKGK
ncbi:MAG: nickel-responsive transcriptional regulator NikR [Verrucomicrobia bacterium]|nr:MAG: nickel-responsive transcriptional regulator NikR [Verrucomicrobiota bacterium]